MEENNVLFEEVNNEVTEVTEVANDTPVAEENEMTLGEAVFKLGVTALTAVGAVTVGKKLIGGTKKLIGKIRDTAKAKKETAEPEVETEDDAE